MPSLLSIPLLGYPFDVDVYRATRKRILSSQNPLVSCAAAAVDQRPDSWGGAAAIAGTEQLLPPPLQYFTGLHLEGIGSAHTRPGQVWPLALMVQGLTAATPEERAGLLRLLLKTQCANGLMHESGELRVRQGRELGHCEAGPPSQQPARPCPAPVAVNADDLSECSREWFGWANSMLVALLESGTGLDCSKAAEAEYRLVVAAQERQEPSDPPRNGGPQDPAYFAGLMSIIAFDAQELSAPDYVGQHRRRRV